MQALLTRLYTYDPDARRDPYWLVDRDLRRLTRFTALWDEGEEAGAQLYGAQEILLTVHVATAWKLCEQDNTSESAGAVVGELHAALLAGDRTLNGLAQSMSYSGSSIEYPGPGERVAGVRYTLDVRYKTPVGNPFI
jgi:hypothetical protein